MLLAERPLRPCRNLSLPILPLLHVLAHGFSSRRCFLFAHLLRTSSLTGDRPTGHFASSYQFGTSARISRLSEAHLSPSTCSTGGYRATTQRRSPFHLAGFIVACNAPGWHGRSGPDFSSKVPIVRAEPSPPLEGLPSLSERQNAITAPLFRSSAARSPTAPSATAVR